MTRFRRYLIGVVAIVVIGGLSVSLSAHDVVYQGTIASVSDTRVDVTVVDAKTKHATEIRFAVTDRTKIERGTHRVTLRDAKMRVGERVAVIVNHDLEKNMVASEIRLPAR